MARFRVALSGDFLKPDGSPAYPMFDLEPLRASRISRSPMSSPSTASCGPRTWKASTP